MKRLDPCPPCYARPRPPAAALGLLEDLELLAGELDETSRQLVEEQNAFITVHPDSVETS